MTPRLATGRAGPEPKLAPVIPLKDYNPTRRFPVVTVLLIVANIYVYFLVQRPSDGDARQLEFSLSYAAIPCELVKGEPRSEREVVRTFGRTNDSEACDPTGSEDSPLAFPDKQVYLATLYSMFLHGSLLHIAGNMLFLWVFGNNIEDYLGKVKFTLFYLAGGMAASIAHVAWTLSTSPPGCTPTDASACVPSVGASGAVAAVMGAYLLLYPRARVNTILPIFFFITVVQVSAVTAMVVWFVSQLVIAWQDIYQGVTEVAWMAHVGGFIFGLLGIFLLGGRPQPPPSHWTQPQWGRRPQWSGQSSRWSRY